MANMITRSITQTTVSGTKHYFFNKELKEEAFTQIIEGEHDEESATKRLQHLFPNTIFMVEKLSINSKRYGMTAEQFIQNAMELKGKPEAETEA